MEELEYDDIVNILEKRFSNEHLKKVSIVELKVRRQKSGETLQELEKDILRLTDNAFPSIDVQCKETVV